MGLLAHCGTNYVSEQEVFAVPEPQWTNSWHPTAHSTIISALQKAVSELGLEIPNKTYSLNSSGTKMFGVWYLHAANDIQITSVLGIRNSIDKSLAFGLCYGTHVFVCDNMAFSGDFVEFKRHTKSLTSEYLLQKFSEILPGVLNKADQFLNWHLDLKKYEISRSDFRLLTFNAMDGNILMPSKFSSFIEAYREENDATLFGFYGAVTRILRGKSLDIISGRTERLNDLIRDYMLSRGFLGNHAEVLMEEYKAGYFDPVGITYFEGSNE
jgi:hypothetical protein